jgi:hypothetical protein
MLFRFATRRHEAKAVRRGKSRSALGMSHAVRIGNAMKDLLFVAITVGFFAAAWLYTQACERL